MRLGWGGACTLQRKGGGYEVREESRTLLGVRDGGGGGGGGGGVEILYFG